uniref:AB hydrolase-1 domain-containing protein n=1 Tax=Meloidogyne incognita TaxID=6306 RepID=A0A914NDM4_MELIC
MAIFNEGDIQDSSTLSPQQQQPSSPFRIIETINNECQSTGGLPLHIATGPEPVGEGFLSWLRWSRASTRKLEGAETRLLGGVTSFVARKFVPVRLWHSSVATLTAKLTAEASESNCPFVLVHGFAAGIGIWAACLDELCKKRTVHAFDILGFARSSRPMFSEDPTLAELEFVQSIEDWRRAMGIEKMILVGHSFGGYLASSYALEHPSRIRHLVLVDPWGFPERPHVEQRHIPVWMRAFGKVLSTFNPLATLRAAGPFGSCLVRTLRSDLGIRYSNQDPDAIFEYIYQCNALNPTGEIAFSSMTKHYGWARRPMINRFNGIDPSVPVTFIWGGKSWMDPDPSYEIQARRQDTSYVDVQIVSCAGHHVYADAPVEFCRLLSQISDTVDADADLPDSPESSSNE